MTSKRKRDAGAGPRQTATGPRRTATSRAGGAAPAVPKRSRWPIYIGGLVIALLFVSVAGMVLGGKSGPTGLTGTVVQGNGGHWTNITPDTLATGLKAKDFTLLNVKTPYIGEISGTDLYIPYTDVAARSKELPANKAAPIVVYCRSGHESAIAAQTLLDLGYTNILNLDGGMDAWTASGHQLVQLNRS